MIVPVSGSIDLAGKGSRLAGFVFKNTGTAATLDFKTGGSAGTVLFSVPLAVGSTTPTFVAQDFSRPQAIALPYLTITGGTIVGAVILE